MTINTKYSLGDEIYAMGNNKVLVEHIKSISINTTIDHKGNLIIETRYETINSRWLNENAVFSSKEELLASL